MSPPPEETRLGREAGSKSSAERPDTTSVPDGWDVEYAPDPERALVGCLLASPTVRAGLLGQVTDDLLGDERLRLVVRALRDLGEPADPVLVGELLAHRGRHDEVPATFLLDCLAEPTAATVAYASRYHAVLVERRRRREQIGEHLDALRALGLDVQVGSGVDA